MKSNEASLFVFIASIIIGILISLNINFNRTYNRVFLSTKQYQDTYNLRNRLRSDISDLQDKYDELSTKLQKYEYGGKNRTSIIQQVESDLNKNKMALGELDVEGQGIKITLNDADNDSFDDTSGSDVLDKIVHNSDINYVINDLRSAGAEAISINGQRVIDRTEVICYGALLRVNGVSIGAPFYINAIGNKAALNSFMLSDGSWLKYLMMRQIYVDVQEMDNIKIQAYNNIITDDFTKELNRK